MAIVWDFVSDRILSALISNSNDIIKIDILKDSAFAGVTAMTLYFLLHRALYQQKIESLGRMQAEQTLRSSE
jgi:hypothetical protein